MVSKRVSENNVKKHVKKSHASDASHATRGPGVPLRRNKIQVQIQETQDQDQVHRPALCIRNTPLRAFRGTVADLRQHWGIYSTTNAKYDKVSEAKRTAMDMLAKVNSFKFRQPTPSFATDLPRSQLHGAGAECQTDACHSWSRC